MRNISLLILNSFVSELISQIVLSTTSYSRGWNENAVIVDTLVNNLDLSPLYDIFQNQNIVKVFHAARQDLEIFYLDSGIFPYPIFDTQIAAMVCGFGDQVAYETLVRQLAKQTLDKSSRFTDWSSRPLTDAQQKYALADVTHLRIIYEILSEQLIETGRLEWVNEELENLISPANYDVDPKILGEDLKRDLVQEGF